MTTVTVNSTAALTKALSSAHAGDTIALAPGTYSNVSIYKVNINGTVNITSQDPTHAAVISGLSVNASSGLAFSQLTISPSHGANTWAAEVLSSSQISFSQMDFVGSSAASPWNQASGLLIQSSSNITVQGSHFEYLNNGAAEFNSSNIQFAGNAFDHLGGDGIDNGGSSYVTISNNNFTDFESQIGGQHPDAIQFWTSNTTTAAHDITVTGNVYDRGAGAAVQGIFITDQVGTLPYENVTITNNVLLGGVYDAIDLDHVTGSVVVDGNTAVSWNGQNTNTGAMISGLFSRIMLMGLTNATVQETGNTTQAYIINNQNVATPRGNQTVGTPTDSGASLMQAWANSHAALLPSFSTDFLSLLGVSSHVHSTVGLNGM